MLFPKRPLARPTRRGGHRHHQRQRCHRRRRCHHFHFHRRLISPPFLPPPLPLPPQVDFKRQKEGDIGDGAGVRGTINVAAWTRRDRERVDVRGGGGGAGKMYSSHMLQRPRRCQGTPSHPPSPAGGDPTRSTGAGQGRRDSISPSSTGVGSLRQNEKKFDTKASCHLVWTSGYSKYQRWAFHGCEGGGEWVWRVGGNFAGRCAFTIPI